MKVSGFRLSVYFTLELRNILKADGAKSARGSEKRGEKSVVTRGRLGIIDIARAHNFPVDFSLRASKSLLLCGVKPRHARIHRNNYAPGEFRIHRFFRSARRSLNLLPFTFHKMEIWMHKHALNFTAFSQENKIFENVEFCAKITKEFERWSRFELLEKIWPRPDERKVDE